MLVLAMTGAYLVVGALDSEDGTGVAGDEPEGEWRVFVPPDASFEVELPGKGTVEELLMEVPGGDDSTFNMVLVGDDDEGHSVLWADLWPLGLGASDEPVVDLGEVLHLGAESMGGEVVREEPAMLAGMQAARFQMHLPDEIVYIGIVASDGQRFYQLMVDESAGDDQDLDWMARTFSLTG